VGEDSGELQDEMVAVLFCFNRPAGKDVAKTRCLDFPGQKERCVSPHFSPGKVVRIAQPEKETARYRQNRLPPKQPGQRDYVIGPPSLRGERNVITLGEKLGVLSTQLERAVGDIELDGTVTRVVRQAAHERRRIGVRREVIVCAGAVASPGVLERSGIGDPDVLRPLGIAIVHANREVGENVSEHRALRMQWRLKRPLSYNRDYDGIRLVWNVMRYYLCGGGPMSVAAIDLRACYRSTADIARPDIQTQFGLFSWNISGSGGGTGLEREHGFCAVTNPISPASKGSIHIRSRDPNEMPEIVANYGAAAEDRAATVAAARLLRRFAEQEPLKQLIDAETLPGPNAQTDEDILTALDRYGCAGMHTVGSCRMGNDSGSVVDPQLRVRGVEGLRVMDASVMPVILAGNTNAPVLAMAWRAAEIIHDFSARF
jgi:choline dehydrogenase-like flavoprotein